MIAINAMERAIARDIHARSVIITLDTVKNAVELTMILKKDINAQNADLTLYLKQIIIIKVKKNLYFSLHILLINT